MIIKDPDEKRTSIATLESLMARPDAGADIRKRIEQEIRNIRAGIKGEEEAAYEINFHYAASKNHAVIHDLRIECDGRVTQIDHLVINRFLDFWVCESKHFSEGISINDLGECSAFYKNKCYGVPSPLEQNKKHLMVLDSLFKSGTVRLPTRLGFSIKPKLNSLVLVSRNARITRPKTKIPDVECIIKNDQFKSFIDRAYEAENNPLDLAKLIGADTLESFARAIAARHQPIEFKWAAKFGLSEKSPAKVPSTPTPLIVPALASVPEEKSVSGAAGSAKEKQKLICASCAEPVAFNVARFCWFNKAKFGGNIYCMECQKAVAGP